MLTGIAYGDDGRPRQVKDPGLFTAGGTRLPFMPYHAAHKYIGKYTRAHVIVCVIVCVVVCEIVCVIVCVIVGRSVGMKTAAL